jgi:hypothetical protein
MYFGATESKRRRADWRPGVPVTLADGRAWHLPALGACRRPDGRPAFRAWGDPARELPIGFADAVQRVAGLVGDDDGALGRPGEATSGALGLVADLLRVNYDVSDAEVERLTFDGGEFLGYADVLESFARVIDAAAAEFRRVSGEG